LEPFDDIQADFLVGDQGFFHTSRCYHIATQLPSFQVGVSR
jgi:hypothetical protein